MNDQKLGQKFWNAEFELSARMEGVEVEGFGGVNFF